MRGGIGGVKYGRGRVVRGHGTLADRVGGTVWEVPLVGWFGVHVGATPRVGGGGKSVDCALVSDLGADCHGLSSSSFELRGGLQCRSDTKCRSHQLSQ